MRLVTQVHLYALYYSLVTIAFLTAQFLLESNLLRIALISFIIAVCGPTYLNYLPAAFKNFNLFWRQNLYMTVVFQTLIIALIGIALIILSAAYNQGIFWVEIVVASSALAIQVYFVSLMTRFVAEWREEFGDQEDFQAAVDLEKNKQAIREVMIQQDMDREWD